MYYSIPDLNERMLAVGATNAELAQKSGCCISTIALLRVGKAKARLHTVETILQTLATKTFKGAYVRQK